MCLAIGRDIADRALGGYPHASLDRIGHKCNQLLLVPGERLKPQDLAALGIEFDQPLIAADPKPTLMVRGKDFGVFGNLHFQLQGTIFCSVAPYPIRVVGDPYGIKNGIVDDVVEMR
jgi:hypothetical protein